MINTKDKNKYKTLTPKQLNKVFIDSCENGYLEVVKYLLTSPDLKEHANIHANNDYGFRWACANGQLEIVKFLIIDMNIDKTNYIELSSLLFKLNLDI